MSARLVSIGDVMLAAYATVARLYKLFGTGPFTYTELRENVLAPSPSTARALIRMLIRNHIVEPVGSFPIAVAAKRFPQLAARKRWSPEVIARNDVTVDVYVLTPKGVKIGQEWAALAR